MESALNGQAASNGSSHQALASETTREGLEMAADAANDHHADHLDAEVAAQHAPLVTDDMPEAAVPAVEKQAVNRQGNGSKKPHQFPRKLHYDDATKFAGNAIMERMSEGDIWIMTTQHLYTFARQLAKQEDGIKAAEAYVAGRLRDAQKHCAGDGKHQLNIYGADVKVLLVPDYPNARRPKNYSSGEFELPLPASPAQWAHITGNRVEVIPRKVYESLWNDVGFQQKIWLAFRPKEEEKEEKPKNGNRQGYIAKAKRFDGEAARQRAGFEETLTPKFMRNGMDRSPSPLGNRSMDRREAERRREENRAKRPGQSQKKVGGKKGK